MLPLKTGENPKKEMKKRKTERERERAREKKNRENVGKRVLENHKPSSQVIDLEVNALEKARVVGGVEAGLRY